MYNEAKEFEKLAGKEFDFYGIDGNRFKLDDTVWLATEDESDGYRSYLGSIEVINDSSLVFFHAPIARVRIEQYDEPGTLSSCDKNEGFSLVDTKDGHVWLKVGTNDYTDYYPYFVFEYKPKKTNLVPA